MSQLSSHSRALILTGGGARAAYQVGVLKAIGELLPEVMNVIPHARVDGLMHGRTG